jgi:hypothetical protein
MTTDEIPVLATRFVEAALKVLKADRVVPTSRFHPWVRAGRDYYGPDVMRVPEFAELERCLNETFPERFERRSGGLHAEFANSYVLSLLEAAVARCGMDWRFEETQDAGPMIAESIDELLQVLQASSHVVTCCREVSQIATADGAEHTIWDVTVVPEAPLMPRSHFMDRVESELPAAPGTFNRERPGRTYSPPHALLIARAEVVDLDQSPYGATRVASATLDRFTLCWRLLTCATVRASYEVEGASTLVAATPPRLTVVESDLLGPLLTRTVPFTGTEGPAFEGLNAMLESADVNRDGSTATPLAIALGRFNASFSSAPSELEHLVDLATALEAIMSARGDDTESLNYRLRNRVTALLACDADTGPVLFNDVGFLYTLRSRIVHGSEVSHGELKKLVRRISVVPEGEVESTLGLSIARVVDRMRDIVRRAILARLALAASPDPLWPFSEERSIDATLADDDERLHWRQAWRDRFASIGASQATDPAADPIRLGES